MKPWLEAFNRLDTLSNKLTHPTKVLIAHISEFSAVQDMSGNTYNNVVHVVIGNSGAYLSMSMADAEAVIERYYNENARSR